MSPPRPCRPRRGNVLSVRCATFTYQVPLTRRDSVGHHSTSDDSFAYRARSEVDDRKKIDNPIVRFRLFMESRGWWDAQAEENMKASLKADVMTAFKIADSMKRCELGELFTDIYGGEEPWNIVCVFIFPD